MVVHMYHPIVNSVKQNFSGVEGQSSPEAGINPPDLGARVRLGGDAGSRRPAAPESLSRDPVAG
jgi:hypothetical protein